MHFFSKKKLHLILSGAALTIASSSLMAQSNQQTVVVTGSRFEENLNEVPANVKIISREEIANSTSQNIPDVLSQIGGLSVRSTNGGQLNLDATVDMGGYGATANSTTLVLVDGQRINSIDSGGINWESIPIDSIERIEVLQGGASVQYGNGAVGGVINIITNGNKSSLNQASVSYGSFGTVIGNAIVRDSVDQTTYQVAANTSNSNGWRQNSAANAYSIDGKLTQSFGGIDKAYIDLFYAYTNAQNPGGVVGQVGQGNPQSAKFNNIGSNTTTSNQGVRFGGTKELSGEWMGELDGSYSSKTTWFYNPYYDTQTAVDVGNAWQIPANSGLSGWQFNLTPRVKGNLGSFGTGIFGYELNRASQGGSDVYGQSQWNYFNGWLSPNAPSHNSQSASVLNQSLYGIIKLPIIGGLSFDGGARHQVQQANATDSNVWVVNSPTSTSQKYSANAGDVAFNYKYSDSQKIYAKWNQSYRFPNIDEFWGTQYFGGDGYRVFNGILAPQINQTYEVGGNWLLNVVRVNGSIFTSTSQNEISYNPATGRNYNSPYNIDRKGIVLDSSINATSRLTVAGGGKYQRSFYANGPFANNSVPLVPEWLLNARVNYLINENWSFGGVVNYVGSQQYDSDPSKSGALATMPSYTFGDIYLNYVEKNLDLKLMVKNVGNATYATYGGYGFVTNANGTGANQYYYYPSDPRSFFITAKYKF
jgi:iron complex outermembrane receptor protein